MKPVLLLAMLVTAALAGCTGQVDVQQTEPLRIRIEDGSAGGTSEVQQVNLRVDSSGARERTVVIDKTETVERINVEVTVNAVSQGSGTGTTNTTGGNNTTGTGATDVIINIIVRVQGGETLQEQQVTAPQGGTATQVLDVDVKGKNNVVVVTQAVAGVADVNVKARGGSAQTTSG